MTSTSPFPKTTPDPDPGVRPTADAITAEVIRLATEYPDAQYPKQGIGSCSYLEGAAGPGEGCIFGQALRNLGVSEDFLRAQEGTSIYAVAGALGVLGNGTSREFSWVGVQRDQDQGRTWGKAVEHLRGNRE